MLYGTPHTAALSAVCCKKQQQQQTPRAQQCTSSLLIPCAHGKLNVKHYRTTPKPEIHVYHSSKSEAALARKLITKTNTSGAAAAVRVRTYTSEADFHKSGIYGGVRVWANSWDVFHCTPSRCGRGRRAAVDIFRGVYWVRRDFFGVFFFRFLRTHTAYCTYEDTLPRVPVY